MQRELLSVAAKMRLGIDEERDEDGFTDNEYVLTDIAYQLAQALVFGRFTHSASEPLLHDVLALGEKVNRKPGLIISIPGTQMQSALWHWKR
ncbi:hypothetical protein IE984_05145 [Klebsiella pneumoniae]|nr:hypothetical protein [Klebsiella pneumoniae]